MKHEKETLRAPSTADLVNGGNVSGGTGLVDQRMLMTIREVFVQYNWPLP